MTLQRRKVSYGSNCDGERLLVARWVLEGKLADEINYRGMIAGGGDVKHASN